MSDLDNIHISFSTLSDNNLISLLQYGDDQFDDTKNKKISMSNIRFLHLVASSTYISIYFYCISLYQISWFGCFQYLYLNILLLYISFEIPYS